MPNKLAHFAIEATDVERARAFYQAVFGWDFKPWGPPGFYLIDGAGVHGALQSRKSPPQEGRKGFECTFAVYDLDKTIGAIEQAGGAITSDSVSIPTVGELVGFTDTEGNDALIMQYKPARLRELGL
ncbi:MAG: VOC family protein [Pseudomonadota bacterium]